MKTPYWSRKINRFLVTLLFCSSIVIPDYVIADPDDSDSSGSNPPPYTQEITGNSSYNNPSLGYSSPSAPAATMNLAGSNYVALGDSRAAGPLYTDMSFSPCDRSHVSYPDLVASYIHIPQEINVSCIGAKMKNIFAPQRVNGQFVPPQINALNARTQVVTLSIGGNDIYWFGLIHSCFTATMGVDARCRMNRSLPHVINQRLGFLKTNMSRVLDSIHKHAPHASVFLVGHGGYYGRTGCPIYVQSSSEDLAWIADFFHKFNLVMAQTAQANNASFIDINTPAIGHDACKPPGVAWFSGNTTEDGTPKRHPTRAGSKAMAVIIANVIRRVLTTGKNSLPAFVHEPDPLHAGADQTPNISHTSDSAHDDNRHVLPSPSSTGASDPAVDSTVKAPNRAVGVNSPSFSNSHRDDTMAARRFNDKIFSQNFR